MAPQSSRWCFTINNPTEEDANSIIHLSESSFRNYMVVGRETGEHGTRHLQGFVVFTRSMRLSRVALLLPRAHLEPTRGSAKQALDYCKKDGDFDEYGTCPTNRGSQSVIEPFIDWGEGFIRDNGRAPNSPEVAREHPVVYLRYPRARRLLDNLTPIPALRSGEPRQWQSELAGKLDGPADDRSIIFAVDPEGGHGKSWFQGWYLSKNLERVQVLSIGKRDDIAFSIDEGKEVFLFNVPRGGMEFLQYTILEQLKDRMVFSPKYASKMKYLKKTPHVVVFCNEEPDYNKMTNDRYDVINEFNT